MNEGASYPRAQSEAFLELTPPTTFPDLSQPNNILGYQYVKAARELNASIQPETIQRTGSGYHSEDLEEKKVQSPAQLQLDVHCQTMNLKTFALSCQMKPTLC